MNHLILGKLSVESTNTPVLMLHYLDLRNKILKRITMEF